jgi:hypothetical protein
MAVIEARDLRKAYGTVRALDGIDLHVEAGRILPLGHSSRGGCPHPVERALTPWVVRYAGPDPPQTDRSP